MEAASAHPRSSPLPLSSSLVADDGNVLPLDVLRCIFSYIPLYPRLRVLGLVCRRWRSAALHLPATIDFALPSSALNQAVSMLPNLTTLRVCEPLAPRPFTTLRTLSCHTLPIQCFCNSFTLCTSLTDLDLSCAPCCNGLAMLLPRNANSLTRLSVINFNPSESWPGAASFAAVLATVHLPALRELSLRLHSGDLRPAFAPFIARHSSQLTSFKWLCPFLLDELYSLSFVHLRHLQLVFFAFESEQFDAALARMPRLTSLGLELDTLSAVEVSRKRAALLTDLSLLRQAANSPLPYFPRLRRLSEIGSGPIWKSYIQFLESLEVTLDSQLDVRLLSDAARLTELRIALPALSGSLARSFEGVSMPALRTFHIWGNMPFPKPQRELGLHLCEIVSMVLRGCPKLRSIYFNFALADQIKPQLLQLVQAAEKAGVERFSFPFGTAIFCVTELAMSVKWMRVQHVYRAPILLTFV